MRAAYSRHMLFSATFSPMLVLCLIHSSNVKRFRPPVIFDFHPQLTDIVSVRHASGRTFQLHVFIRGTCHPCVCFISFFRPCRPVLIDLSKSVFRTSHMDVSTTETSSCVDLGPLYGNNKETLNKIRVRDGRGLLLPDMFAEDRLLLLPPAVCVLLILFSRNHNVRFWPL